MRSALRRWLAWGVFPWLAGCGGAVDVSFWWHGGSCAVAPAVTSRPPLVAVAGQPYVYQLLFALSADCDTRPDLGGCFYVVPVRLPSGAVFDSVNHAVTWTPAAAQAGTRQAFEIVTVTVDCDRRVSWAWTVEVAL